MESIIKITEFQKTIEKETVLKLMDCKEDSPIYEEVQREFSDLLQEVERRLDPKAVIGFGKVAGELESEKLKAGEDIIYILSTVGGEVSRYSSESFEEGDFFERDAHRRYGRRMSVCHGS